MGEPRVGHRRAAGQVLQLGALRRPGRQPLEPARDGGVHLVVHARDEERGDRDHGRQRPAAGGAVLQPGEVRLHHLLVAGQREDERDVHAHALADQGADGGQALGGGGDLDHHVGPADPLAQPPRLGHGARGVVRQPGVHLDADPAVQSAAALEHLPQQVAGGLHVLDGQRLVQRKTGQRRGACQLLADGVVVVGALADGLLEDGRVRGDAGHALVAHLGGEAAGPQLAAVDVVEPDALAEVEQLLGAAGHVGISRLGTGQAHGCAVKMHAPARRRKAAPARRGLKRRRSRGYHAHVSIGGPWQASRGRRSRLRVRAGPIAHTNTGRTR